MRLNLLEILSCCRILSQHGVLPYCSKVFCLCLCVLFPTYLCIISNLRKYLILNTFLTTRQLPHPFRFSVLNQLFSRKYHMYLCVTIRKIVFVGIVVLEQSTLSKFIVFEQNIKVNCNSKKSITVIYFLTKSLFEYK